MQGLVLAQVVAGPPPYQLPGPSARLRAAAKQESTRILNVAGFAAFERFVLSGPSRAHRRWTNRVTNLAGFAAVVLLVLIDRPLGSPLTPLVLVGAFCYRVFVLLLFHRFSNQETPWCVVFACAALP